MGIEYKSENVASEIYSNLLQFYYEAGLDSQDRFVRKVWIQEALKQAYQRGFKDGAYESHNASCDDSSTDGQEGSKLHRLLGRQFASRG